MLRSRTLFDAGPVLVTGGAGFIGCALSRRLAGDAVRWIVVDSLHPQVHSTAERPASLHPAAELIVADITDDGVLDRVIHENKPELIIHLCAETGTAQSLDQATRHAHVNVVGTTMLTDALARAGHLPRRILLTSSRAVYGEGVWRHDDGSEFNPGQRSHAQLAAGIWDVPAAVAQPSRAGKTPPAPVSVYGATKLAQEHVLAAWGLAHGVGISILRLQNVYGPGQSLTNSYTGIVALFSQLARSGKSIPVYEDGRIVRDFVYIDDVVEAIAATLTSTRNAASELFDVGSGIPSTILDLANLLAERYDAPAPAVNGRYRDGDVRFAACDIAQTTEAIGWTPTWSLAAGLADLQGWIDSQLGARGVRF